MGEDPRHIKERIEQTREEMGDTVEALASKADVPGRVKGAVADKKDAALEKMHGVKSSVTGGTSSAAGATSGVAGQAKEQARRGAGIAQENPLGLAIASVGAGLVLGMLLPSTRVEDERLGPVADGVKQQAREVAGEAADHAKQVAQDVAETATETAREHGQEHAHELRESVASSR
jgi:uncharacterized protein DUF3618